MLTRVLAAAAWLAAGATAGSAELRFSKVQRSVDLVTQVREGNIAPAPRALPALSAALA